MSIFKNIFGFAKSTVKGVLTAAGAASAAGVVAAAQHFGQSGDTTNWTPYAAAAVAAAVPALVGAFSKDDTETTPLSESAKQVAITIEQAGKDYATKKTDEFIASVQAQLNK